MLEEMTCQELNKKLSSKEDFVLIDVREQDEYNICHLDQAKLIPLDELPGQLKGLDKKAEYVIHCKMGGRSAQACAYMQEHGFKNVKNLVGGIRQWAMEIDPSMELY